MEEGYTGKGLFGMFRVLEKNVAICEFNRKGASLRG